MATLHFLEEATQPSGDTGSTRQLSPSARSGRVGVAAYLNSQTLNSTCIQSN